ncbi:hypothetical protein BLAHAN_06366 [Blautia hansenii DSM 20583]|uniref:Uncharacterized protein n=1 Tax=Blautia hansenii DSM 20583 TaxID=537007 RepID=C9LAB6_BLAHA|nr:hypothetical protein BLAHAN_06366 [Blautia hansenii DSM 20583]
MVPFCFQYLFIYDKGQSPIILSFGHNKKLAWTHSDVCQTLKWG